MRTTDEELMRMIKKLEAQSRRKRGCGCNHTNQTADGEQQPQEVGQGIHGRGRLMARLRDNGPMSQSQLAALLDIRPQSLSELISKMENEGLVSRIQSEEDKRQTIVSLTEAGKEKIAVISEARRRHAEELFSPLTDEEKNVLFEILQKLTESHSEAESESAKTEV